MSQAPDARLELYHSPIQSRQSMLHRWLWCAPEGYFLTNFSRFTDRQRVMMGTVVQQQSDRVAGRQAGNTILPHTCTAHSGEG